MPSLFSLAEEIRRCTACPLYKNTTLAVPGEGPKDAKIMLIGEAPGEEEDRLGAPFAGRSGKVLDEMLKLAGLDRKQVFITNIVKHRPPQNRMLNAGEIKSAFSTGVSTGGESAISSGLEKAGSEIRPSEASMPLVCSPAVSNFFDICKRLWLDRQIAALKPKLIVLLGAAALKSLTKEASVTKLHGKVITKDGQKYFVAVHPSAALRNPDHKKKMEEDFRRLGKIPV